MGLKMKNVNIMGVHKKQYILPKKEGLDNLQEAW